MLGVPVNASAKDLAANKGRMKLLDIGKDVAFPLDLPGLLSPINRSKESVTIAERDINLPQDKLRHALMWFARPSDPLGKLAYDHLLQGNIDTAITNFKRSASWESRLCLSTIFLIKNDIPAALSAVWSVIDLHCSEFVAGVAGQTFSYDTDAVRSDYLSALASMVDIIDVYPQLSQSDVPDNLIDGLRTAASSSLIAIIEKEIAKAKAVDKDNATAQHEAGKTLSNNTHRQRIKLEKLLGKNDPRYSRLVDKLAGQIFQCSVNYHNAIDNATDEPVGATVIDECLKLARYAHSIAIGKMTKDRVQNGIGTLEDKKSKLPPAEVETEAMAIAQALRRFVSLPDKISYSVALINDTRQHLQSIKAKLGPVHSFYLQLSSQVVGNALHNCVAEVNAAQESEVIELNGTRYSVGSDKTKEAVRAAWNCTKMMDGFDMDSQTRSHFDTNKNTLRNMCSQLGVSTSPYSTTSRVSRPQTSSFSSTPQSTQSTSKRNTSAKDGDYTIASIILVEGVWLIIAAIAASNDGNFWDVFILGSIVGWTFYVNILVMMFFNWLLSKIFDK